MDSDLAKDKLVKIIECALYCLYILDAEKLSWAQKTEMVYQELSNTLGDTLDENIISHAEYDYIIYKSKLKVQLQSLN